MSPRKATSGGTPADAEALLAAFIDKFGREHQALLRAARDNLRRRFPWANEIVYDNYNFFVIGYGPTERPSDCFISLTGAANGIGLCFLHGATLPDPAGILQGSGKQTRFIRLPGVGTLDRPEVETLLRIAVERAATPPAANTPGRLIIRSVSAKQRKRRMDA